MAVNAQSADIESITTNHVLEHMLDETIMMMQEAANGALSFTGAKACANPEETLAIATAAANITSQLREW